MWRARARALLAGLVVALPAAAQVTSVVVSKDFGYFQTSASAIAVDAAANAYGFSADVNGTNIGGITPPRVTGPFNTAALGPTHNNGVLLYSAGDEGWRYGSPNANDFGAASQSVIDNLFPSGTYTFTVNGATVPLTLSGNAFPNAPVLTLTGGTWRDGKYVIDPAQPLTITTNDFTAYGTHADDLICIALIGGQFRLPFAEVAPAGCGWTQARQFASQVPGSKRLSYTVPAGTLESGQEYIAGAIFAAIVDSKPNGSLPGSANVAAYSVRTLLRIKAESQVFPLTVTGSIGPVTSTITADIQYRPQDVGTNGSVYVFAVAPQPVVKSMPLEDAMPPLAKAGPGDGAKDTAPVACVLAQLNAQGQLQQVSASSMQAYVSGVLGAQGASVAVLNGTSTANIAGATFYVGYGSSAQSMLSNGITRSVVAVPGSAECTPRPPQTGWWWNPLEGGRGFSLEVSGRNIFFAAYLYDDAGRPKWYVATGATSVDGSLFTGDLLELSGGQTLSGPYRAPSSPRGAGPVTVAFSSESTGTLVWPGGTVPIQRFPIAAGGLSAPARLGEPEGGWWWNPDENGRGFFIEWQSGTADIAGYLYDDAGNPVWYLTVAATPNASQLAGNWWSFGGGQTLTGPYRAPIQTSANVAPLAIQFDSSTTATLTLPGGRATRLQRFRF